MACITGRAPSPLVPLASEETTEVDSARMTDGLGEDGALRLLPEKANDRTVARSHPGHPVESAFLRGELP